MNKILYNRFFMMDKMLLINQNEIIESTIYLERS